jgi:hypothetical protein
MRAVVLGHEQLLKACIQYVFSPPVAIERCCGINANHGENCQLTNSDLEPRVAIAIDLLQGFNDACRDEFEEMQAKQF